MENFKKGFMATMGVLFAIGIWSSISDLVNKSDKDVKKTVEAEKTE